MPLNIIIYGLVYHFFFDWYLQSRQDAARKSEDVTVLLRHGIVIFVGVIFLFLGCGISLLTTLMFGFIYTFLHLVQDYHIYFGLKNEGQNMLMYKPFWDRIAFDQFLHLVVLFTLLSWAI